MVSRAGGHKNSSNRKQKVISRSDHIHHRKRSFRQGRKKKKIRGRQRKTSTHTAKGKRHLKDLPTTIRNGGNCLSKGPGQ